MIERRRASQPGPPCRDVAAIYRAHGAQVMRWVARLGGPHIEVDDLVQEIFLAVHRKLSGFRWDCQVTTWLYTITARMVRKARRRAWLRRWLSAGPSEAAEPVSSWPTPAESLEQRSAQQLVYAALDRLPDKLRTAMILFELEGMAGEEIAVLLDAKPATIWVRLHRARAAFLRELERIERQRSGE